MADKFAKRPKVQRFNQKKTYAGRTVKRTVLTRRNRPMLNMKKGRNLKPMRAKK